MDNLSAIQVKIREFLEKFEKLVIIGSHLETIEDKLKEAYAQLEILDRKLDDELKDIQRIESIGVRSVFHKVLGNQEEQIEKERQEYLEASLKYQEYKKSVDLLEYEKGLLEKKISQKPLIEKELNRLKSEREKEILLSRNPELRGKLSDLIKRHDLFILLLKDIHEALEEGEKSQKMLSIVLSYLKKARDWGRWEKKSKRRGMNVKNRAIDQAMKNLSKAQLQLNLFDRELKDLGKSNLNLKINSSHFDKFTDFFFDNLISDWIVQQKIKSTIASVESVDDHVKRICMSLLNEDKECKSEIEKLENEREKILLS